MPNVFQWDSPNVGNASPPGPQQAQSAKGTAMRCPHRIVLPQRTPLPIWHWCIPRHHIPEPVTKGASATKALSTNVGGIVTDRRCCRHGVTAKANPERLHDKATGLNTYIIADAGTFDGPDGSGDTCAHGDRCGFREFCPSAFPQVQHAWPAKSPGWAVTKQPAKQANLRQLFASYARRLLP